MNFGTLFKAFDARRRVSRRRAPVQGSPSEPPPPETSLSPSAAAQGLAGQIETRLTNVVVAALKEAFDRDHARLELERAQLEEQRRRAEEALRLELRRQAIDRELARLRLLAGTALVGWIASIAVLFVHQSGVAVAHRPRRRLAALLGALGAAFNAQGRRRMPSGQIRWTLVPCRYG